MLKGLAVLRSIRTYPKTLRAFPFLIAGLRMFGPNGDLMAPETPNARTEVKTSREVRDSKQAYYEKRIRLFEQYFEREVQKIEAAKERNVSIKITLPDGTEREGTQSVTTPFDIALAISKSLAKKSVVAHVNGEEWDLTRPLETDCKLQLFGFETAEGKEVCCPEDTL